MKKHPFHFSHSDRAQKMRISLAVRGHELGTIANLAMEISKSSMNRFATASSR